ADPAPGPDARRSAAPVIRHSGPARASARPLLVILPPTVVLDGATEVECPEVSGPAAAYLDRPGVTCALVDPADLDAHAAGGVARLDLALPGPPPGYRRAWEDGRINPHAGVRTVEGEMEMRQIWTDTVPRRLIRSE
ncbi:hypothetical protein P6F26_14805, partial [Roseibacterium sp. SDUM158017]|nr:hypothetical protein [Roseibacterium sp. SDUM158017]